MVQFLLINFFSWIYSIFVGVFKSSRFLCHPVFTSSIVKGTRDCIINYEGHMRPKGHDPILDCTKGCHPSSFSDKDKSILYFFECLLHIKPIQFSSK